MAKELVVLEKIDVGKDVVKYHHVQPVGIVVIVKGDGGAGVDDRLVGVVGVELVAPLFLQHINVMDPVVVEGWDHHLGAQFDHVPVGDDIFEALVGKT
jgi:hypothetical protein